MAAKRLRATAHSADTFMMLGARKFKEREKSGRGQRETTLKFGYVYIALCLDSDPRGGAAVGVIDRRNGFHGLRRGTLRDCAAEDETPDCPVSHTWTWGA